MFVFYFSESSFLVSKYLIFKNLRNLYGKNFSCKKWLSKLLQHCNVYKQIFSYGRRSNDEASAFRLNLWYL